MFMESDRKAKVIRIAVWVAILGLLLGVLSSIISATTAEAHAALNTITPKDGASLSTPPAAVVLTFNEPISPSFAAVTVAGSAGEVSTGRAAVEGPVVTQALPPDLPPGAYRVSFRVVSKDGHTVSDTTTFTLAAQGAPTTSPPASAGPTTSPDPSPTRHLPAPPPSGAPEASAADDDRPMRLGLAFGVGALALAAGTALVFVIRSRSSE